MREEGSVLDRIDRMVFFSGGESKELGRNVIYLVTALHRDAAPHGNHWKIKCIF